MFCFAREKKFVAALIAVVLLSGCSTFGGGSLLENPQLAAEPAAVAPALSTPPEEDLAPATAADVQNAKTEETDLGPETPTVAQLDSTVLPGIDAAKTAATLEDDVMSKKVSSNLKWRGKRSDDGYDVADANGTLCSGARDQGGTITLACSDGRVAQLTLNPSAKIRFGKNSEDVDLAN